MSLSPRAKLQAYVKGDEFKEIQKKGWGNYVQDHPEDFIEISEHPDLPGPDANSRMVWHPILKKYVKGHKAYNYLPDLRMWLNKKRDMENRNRLRRSTRRSVSRNSRRRSVSRNSRRRSPSRRSPSRRSPSRSYTRRR
jgi:hypothetical protein